MVLREAGKESQFAFRNTFFCILLFIRWSYVGSSILVGTKVVVNSYMRLRNKFKLFPTKNQLTQQVHCTPGLEWRTGMVFGRKWLEFISHSQTKGDYNFRYYIYVFRYQIFQINGSWVHHISIPSYIFLLFICRYAAILFKKQRYVSGQHKQNIKIVCKDNFKYEVQERAATNAVSLQQLAEEYWRIDKFFLISFPILFFIFNIIYWLAFIL